MTRQTLAKEILKNGWVALVYQLAFGRIVYCVVVGYTMEPGEIWVLSAIMVVTAVQYFVACGKAVKQYQAGLLSQISKGGKT